MKKRKSGGYVHNRVIKSGSLSKMSKPLLKKIIMGNKGSNVSLSKNHPIGTPRISVFRQKFDIAKSPNYLKRDLNIMGDNAKLNIQSLGLIRKLNKPNNTMDNVVTSINRKELRSNFINNNKTNINHYGRIRKYLNQTKKSPLGRLTVGSNLLNPVNDSKVRKYGGFRSNKFGESGSNMLGSIELIPSLMKHMKHVESMKRIETDRLNDEEEREFNKGATGLRSNQNVSRDEIEGSSEREFIECKRDSSVKYKPGWSKSKRNSSCSVKSSACSS